MTKQTEAMKLALDALESAIPHKKRIGDDGYLEGAWTFHNKAITALREALAEQPEQRCSLCNYQHGHAIGCKNNPVDIALNKMAENARELRLDYEPAQQEPVAWKLVPTKPTEEMLKAMDECSKEGYDERLYAGHAASVYMAAVDAAPAPPAQRTWVGLTDEERKLVRNSVGYNQFMTAGEYSELVQKATEAKLKEKNQ